MPSSKRLKLVARAGVGLLFAGAAVTLYLSLSPRWHATDNARPVDVMQALIIRVEELYDAGYDRDWRRAQDAVSRVQRTAARLYGKDIYWEEQWNISRLAEALLPGEIDAMAGAIRRQDRDAFLVHFRGMIAACNACHQTTRQMIVVEEPPRREQRRRSADTQQSSADSYWNSKANGSAPWPSPKSTTST